VVDAVALHSGDYVRFLEQLPLDRVTRIVERLDFPDTAEVLDVGCGNGMLLHALGNRTGTYTGVDFSSDCIESANRWAKAEGKSNYRFVRSEIVEFCGRHQAAFDIAAALDFSEHVETDLAERIFSAVRTSLRPGGRFYLHTPNLDFFVERAKQVGLLRQFPEHIAVRNPSQMVQLLVASGFAKKRIRIDFIPHYNILRLLHPLSYIPVLGRLFRARLLITAHA
jgi:2-polyprenyl-3-methyl-5-hydroxy-6-metoxy-1,4-benzoquinol methylase